MYDVEKALEDRRSIRRFSNVAVPYNKLLRIVELGRLYPSPCNCQPLKFAIITQEQQRKLVFSKLKWAMCLKDYRVRECDQPKAYILLLGDKRITSHFELCEGAAIVTMQLAALAQGLATCCLGVQQNKLLCQELEINESFFELLCVIAVGIGAQKGTTVALNDGETAYKLDETGNIIVPKRTVADVLIKGAQEISEYT